MGNNVTRNESAQAQYPDSFIKANAFTQKWEKGYVNHANDPGGPTYNGVSLRFLKQTGVDVNEDGHIDAKDILHLYKTQNQAKVDNIFYKAFWRDFGLDKYLSLPVQAVLYDSAVNTGRTQTIKFLQRALNKVGILPVQVDGQAGPATLKALQKVIDMGKAKELASAIIDARLDFHNLLVNSSPYKDGRDYRPFANGWRNRIKDQRKFLAALEE